MPLRSPAGPKRAEEVARRIEIDIMERGWPEGELLGSEPELIERYGVSRAVFREAVRIVEHHGAAQMRRGPSGGLFVTAPSLEGVQYSATLYLDHADVSADDLFAVRSALELTCVRLLAETIDEEGIARLREVIAGEPGAGGDAELERSHDLHVVIAELTGNAALRLFVEILTRLTHERTGRLSYHERELGEVHRAHELIVEAIIVGDAALAQHRMRAHLAAAGRYYHRRDD